MTTLPASGSTRSTRPVVPASSPVVMITLSSLRMFMLHHFRRQADDLEEAALAQLAGHGAEDARALGVLVFLVDDDHRVAVEAHVAAVVAARRLLDADDHALDDVARLDVAAG